MTQNNDIVIFDNSKDIKDPVWTCVKQALEKRMKMLEEGGYETSDEFALAKERYTGLTFRDVTIEEPIYFTDGRVQVCMVSRKTGFGRVDILIEKVSFLDVAREFGLKILQVNTRKQLENLIEAGSVQENLIHLAYSDEYVMMIPGVDIKAEVEAKLDHIFFINATMSTSPLDYSNYTTAVLNLRDPSIPDTPIKVIKVNEVRDLILANEVEIRPTQVTPYALTENVEVEVPVVIEKYDKDVLTPLTIHSVRAKNGSISPTDLQFVMDGPGKSGKFVFKSLFDLEKDHLDDELFIVMETTSPNLPEGMTIQTDEISIKFNLTYDRIRVDIREVSVSNELGNRDLTFKLYDKLKKVYITKDLIGYNYVLDGKWIKPNGKAVYSEAKGKFVYPVTTNGWGDATITMTGNQRNSQSPIRTDVPVTQVSVTYLDRVFTKPDQLTVSMKVSYHNGLIPRVVELMNPFHTTTNCFEDTKVPTSVVYDKETGICKFTFKIVPATNERKEYRFISNADLLDEGVSKRFDFTVAIEHLEPQPSIELHDMTIEDRVATARYRVIRADGSYPDSINMVVPFKTADNTTGGVKTPSSVIYNPETGFCTFTFPVVMDTTQDMTYKFESEVWFINEDNKFPFSFTKVVPGGREVSVVQNYFSLEGSVANVQLTLSYPDKNEKPKTSVLKKPFDATSNTLDGTLMPKSDSYDALTGVHTFSFDIDRNDDVVREYRFRSSVTISDKDGNVSVKPFISGGDKHPSGKYVISRKSMGVANGELVLNLFVNAEPGADSISDVTLRRPLTAVSGTLNNTMTPSSVAWNPGGGYLTITLPAYINRFEDVKYALGGELLINGAYSPSFMEEWVWEKAVIDTLTVTNLPTIETETELKFKYKVRYNEDLIPPSVTLKVPFDTASEFDVSDKTPTSSGYDPVTGEGFFVFPYTKGVESKTARVGTTVTDGKFNLTSNISNTHLIKPRYKLVCTPQASRTPKKYYRIDGQTYVEFSFTVAATDGTAITNPTVTVTSGSLVTNTAMKNVTWDAAKKEFTLLCEATAVKGLGLTVDGKVVETGGKDGVFTVILDIPEGSIPEEVVTARIDVTQLEAEVNNGICTFNFKAAYNTGHIPKRGVLVTPFTTAEHTTGGTKDPMEPFVYNEQTGFGYFKFSLDMSEGLPVTRHFVSKFTWPGVNSYESAFNFVVNVGAKTTLVTTVDGSKPDGTFINEVLLTLVNDQGLPFDRQNVLFSSYGPVAFNNPNTVTNAQGIAVTKVSSNTSGVFTVSASVNSKSYSTTVAFLGSLPNGTVFTANGADFKPESSFPSTGFVGAEFTVKLPSGKNAIDYNWTTDKDWVTVSPAGLVKFIKEPKPEDRIFSVILAHKTDGSYLGHVFKLGAWFKPDVSGPKTYAQAEAFAAGLGQNYRIPHNKALSNAIEGQLGKRIAGSLYGEWGNTDAYQGWPSSANPFWSSTERSSGINNIISVVNGGNTSAALNGENNAVAGFMLNKDGIAYIDIGLHSNGYDMPLTNPFPTTGFTGANFQIRIKGKVSEASKYDWVSNQTWCAVDPTGKVTFTAAPNKGNRSVIITATNKTDAKDVIRYAFSIKYWFMETGVNKSIADASKYLTDTFGPQWKVPPIEMMTNNIVGGVVDPDYIRISGNFWGEWGNSIDLGFGSSGTTGNTWNWCVMTTTPTTNSSSEFKNMTYNLKNGVAELTNNGTERRVVAYRDVEVSPNINPTTKFIVNGHDFLAPAGFPTTAFEGAKFRIAVNGDVANNTNYTLSVDRDWLTIDADGNVNITGKPTPFTKTASINLLSKLTGELSQYTFTIKWWFKRNAASKGNALQAKEWVKTLGPNWRVPHHRQCSGAEAEAAPSPRGVGNLWGEWGPMGTYGWPTSWYWCCNYWGGGQYYLVGLSDNYRWGTGSPDSYNIMGVEELVDHPIQPDGTEIVINKTNFMAPWNLPTTTFTTALENCPKFSIDLSKSNLYTNTDFTWESNRSWCTVDYAGNVSIVGVPGDGESEATIKITQKSTGTVYEYHFTIGKVFSYTPTRYTTPSAASEAVKAPWSVAMVKDMTSATWNTNGVRRPYTLWGEWGNLLPWVAGTSESLWVMDPPGSGYMGSLVTAGAGLWGGSTGGIGCNAWTVKKIL